MSNVGRNIGADIPRIGMRWDIDKNGKATRKWGYYDRHSDFYDSLYKFLYGILMKHFLSFVRDSQRSLNAIIQEQNSWVDL